MATNPHMFLVGALPRSGSCWIATVLNLSSEGRCLHEGPAYYENPIHEIKGFNGQCSGDCGSHVMIEDYNRLPARRVFIHRNKEAVKRSTLAFFQRCNGEQFYQDKLIDDLYEQALEWVRQFQPLVIPYHELFLIRSVERIWKHCMPELEFPKAKAEQLLSVNIQIKDFDMMAKRHKLLEVAQRLNMEARA